MSVAFGVPQSGDVGTTASDMRQIMGNKWQSAGILGGLTVTGDTSLCYNVAAGAAVCCRAESDGKTEAYYAGGKTPAVSANESAEPRIDVVWITAHDATQGDEDNLVTIGVTEGTTATSPVAPDIPTYATPLADVLLPAGSTTTANATVSDVSPSAVSVTSTLGLLGSARSDYTGQIDKTRGTLYTPLSVTIDLPTARLVEIEGIASVYAKSGNATSWYMSFMLDGTELEYAGGEFVMSPSVCQSVNRRHIVSISKGKHTVSLCTAWQAGSSPVMVRAGKGGIEGYTGTFPGRILRVWDRGTAQ